MTNDASPVASTDEFRFRTNYQIAKGATMNQNEQMRELEAKVRAQTNLIKAMEQTQSHLSSQKAKWEEATRTLESEREANRILTQELEQAKQALSATVKESLTHESAPLVRLTGEEIDKVLASFDDARLWLVKPEVTPKLIANAIQDAMIAKNGGSNVM